MHGDVGDVAANIALDPDEPSLLGARFFKNGDTWTLERIHPNGDLTVRAEKHTQGVVRLSDSYVASAVELGYATTAARAQGRTVDTAHALIDQAMTREALYVAATRARTGAHLYVQNEHLLGLVAERPPAPTLDAMDQLAAVLNRETGQRTATEVQRQAHAIETTKSPRRRPLPTVVHATTRPSSATSRRLPSSA